MDRDPGPVPEDTLRGETEARRPRARSDRPTVAAEAVHSGRLRVQAEGAPSGGTRLVRRAPPFPRALAPRGRARQVSAPIRPRAASSPRTSGPSGGRLPL